MPRCIFTRRLEVPVTGALPSARAGRPGLGHGEEREREETGAGAEPEGLGENYRLCGLGK